MPLPISNMETKWPPEAWAPVYATYREHDAWYSGDPNRLAQVYSSMIYTPTPRGRHWAKDLYEERRTMLHVPLAGDMASVSADLLFSEAPKFTIPEAHLETAAPGSIAVQERLEQIVNDGGIVNRLLEGAESCAAIGGIYLKPTWDRELSPYPILTIAQADNAIPVFRFGILQQVTFWKCIEEDEDVFWRLLEHYEVVNGKTVLLNGLYKGERDTLGIRVGLAAHPATAGLDDEIPFDLPGLAVEYVPNMRPNRRHRGSAVGQSDYSGSEGLLDALDEVYTSWMRDIRLGQGRIIVPEEWLEVRNGEKRFDVDKEVFTTLSVDPLNAGGLGITVSQFEIRTQQHRDTSLELLDRIVAAAGYSPQTFGLKIDGRAESGTALNIRERRSFVTKAKKERYWRPAVERALQLMLQIDRLHLGGKVDPQDFRPSVEFQDSLQNDVSQVAATVELLSRAEALSVQTKVRMVHPDWTAEQIQKEVDAITADRQISMPSPDENSGDFNQG